MELLPGAWPRPESALAEEGTNQPAQEMRDGGQRWGWLCRREGSARQLLCSLTLPLSWDLACRAGQAVRGHKEQPTVTAVTLLPLGALDWLLPALHPHGDHRGG